MPAKPQPCPVVRGNLSSFYHICGGLGSRTWEVLSMVVFKQGDILISVSPLPCEFMLLQAGAFSGWNLGGKTPFYRESVNFIIVPVSTILDVCLHCSLI